MSKPIVVIKIDQEADLGNGRSFYSEHSHIQKFLDDKLGDYHVFVVPVGGRPDEAISLQVFYEKDFTEIQYQELKQMVLDSIQKEKA